MPSITLDWFCVLVIISSSRLSVLTGGRLGRKGDKKEASYLLEGLDAGVHLGFYKLLTFANKKKALHLFNELKKLKIKWACQGSIDIAKDEELVKLMSDSGCIEMLLGFENINIMNIKKMNKKSNYDFDYENIIRIFKKYRILVHASYVIGYDYDTKDYFQEILDFSNKHKFFLAGFNPALPIPGTPFYERLKKEGRLLYERWWLDENFLYGKACFEPYNMTIEEFEAGILKCKVEYNRHSSIWKRLFDGAANFKHALVFLAVNYINRKEVYNKKGIKL